MADYRVRGDIIGEDFEEGDVVSDPPEHLLENMGDQFEEVDEGGDEPEEPEESGSEEEEAEQEEEPEDVSGSLDRTREELEDMTRNELRSEYGGHDDINGNASKDDLIDQILDVYGE